MRSNRYVLKVGYDRGRQIYRKTKGSLQGENCSTRENDQDEPSKGLYAGYENAIREGQGRIVCTAHYEFLGRGPKVHESRSKCVGQRSHGTNKNYSTSGLVVPGCGSQDRLKRYPKPRKGSLRSDRASLFGWHQSGTV